MAAGRLGCSGDIEVFITEKCNDGSTSTDGKPHGKRVCTLTNVATVHWNRILDEISTAQIEIPVGVGTGGGSNPCCGCMALIEPWCHELNIARDGIPVWQGPVTRVTYGFNSVRVEARDFFGWLEKRIPIITLGTTGRPEDLFELTDLAVQVLNAAFSEDDPCVLKNIYQADLNNRPTYIGPIAVPVDNFPTFTGSYFDWMTTLSNLGLDFTIVGRRIVLGVDAADLPIAGVITDEHILGEISYTKDGDLMVNRIYSRYTGDDDAAQCEANAAAGKTPFNSVPCPALIDGPMYCYGPIEKVIEDASGGDLGLGIDAAIQIAQKYLNEGSIAPRTVEVPSGSKLSPDTPFDINELIPGMRVRVAISGLCIEVNSVFKLHEIIYNVDSSGNEEVGITLGPVDLTTGGTGGTI